MTEAVNPDRRAEKVVMKMLGLRRKAFRKWEKRKRREKREGK